MTMNRFIQLAALLALLLPQTAHTGMMGEYTIEPNLPLMDAVRTGDTEAAKRLLANGADVNVKSTDGMTALMEAAGRGYPKAVRLLLANGADVNAKTKDGWTALMLSAFRGHTTIVKLLKEAGVKGPGPLPLAEAAASDDTEAIKHFLAQGANVNAKDHLGMTALIWAAASGHTPVIQALLTQGADVNIPGQNGWNALMWAVKEGHTKTVKLLLENGAHVDAKDTYGYTPLIWASIWADSTEVAESLIKKGADVNAETESGATALMESSFRGNIAMVQLLLVNGANVNAEDNYGVTALMNATFNGQTKVVRVLIKKGADVDAKNKDGKTALMVVEGMGHRDAIVQLLKQAEAQHKLKTARSTLVDPQVAPKLPGAATTPESDVDTVPVVKVFPRKNAYAVVIGIEQYREKLPKADFAARDARLMGDYLTKVLGYPEENVIVRLNEKAAKTDLTKYFEEWLRNNVETGGSVFVYYSGHGAPNPKTGEAYLVPYDGDPTFTDSTAYPLKRLYAALDKLPAKEVVVVLDSCFSGAGGRSVLAKGARPMGIVVENPFLAMGKTMVLAASAGDEISNTFDEQGHGLLTYFFLKGLQGAADTNGDGIMDMTKLFNYVKPNVQRIARKQYNNEQTPQLLASPTLLERGIRLIERGK